MSAAPDRDPPSISAERRDRSATSSQSPRQVADDDDAGAVPFSSVLKDESLLAAVLIAHAA